MAPVRLRISAVNIICSAIKSALLVAAGPLATIAIVILAATTGGGWPALVDRLRTQPGPILYDPALATDLA